MYISSLFEGVSEAPGFSWKAFQWTLAWTPVDRSAVSRLRLPTQQKGQTTSEMISTTARFWSAAAMAVARPRARVLRLLNSALTEHCTVRQMWRQLGVERGAGAVASTEDRPCEP